MKISVRSILTLLAILFGFDIALYGQNMNMVTDSSEEMTDSIMAADPEELFESLPVPVIDYNYVNRSFIPRVFSGYHKLHTFHKDLSNIDHYKLMKVISGDSILMSEEDVIELIPNEDVSKFPDLTFLVPDGAETIKE